MDPLRERTDFRGTEQPERDAAQPKFQCEERRLMEGASGSACRIASR